ncbi:hypothetical protein CC78DRAFT_339478 [Lojkania enalia]|uniref:Uncharacterized protein n=1 Tax=Lojkania enalia TaxID=147567 RepID=A0A9P4K5Y0_9PLEO|nr:hypothetical protein CC78DRAFT_339478 [Didymosphaeria enalia]
MDIRKWLDETVLPERPPGLPEQLGLPAFLCPKEVEEPPREKRRPKRSASDSSMLEACPARIKTPRIEHGVDIDDSTSSDSACSNASQHTTRSSGSSSSSQQYARRPRRKTRRERYEPAAKDVKARGTLVYRHRKRESRKTKRKSRRSKTDKPGIGLVQSFHAKNIPRDRLTLRPREKLGIFNKGKASSPVKGRGLPDLVFSEMKFLQKHKDQPEDAPQAGLRKNKRKKDHAQAKQEEISAYFTSVRPALVGRDVNIQAKEATRLQANVRDFEHERERSSVIDSAIPTVEHPGKATYLGFGSRRPRHESESYISWSESVRLPSVTPVRRASAINIGQRGPIHDRGDGVITIGGDVRCSRLAPSPAARYRKEVSSGRLHISPLVPANRQASRSHSLPQWTCSHLPTNSECGERGRRTVDAGTTLSAMPPSISPEKINHSEHSRLPPPYNKGPSEPRHHPCSPDSLKDTQSQEETIDRQTMQDETNNVDPQTSSTLGKLLQECNSAFRDERQVPAAIEPDASHIEYRTIADNEREVIDTEPYCPRERVRTVCFSGAEVCRPNVPNFSGPSIYEEQARQQAFLQYTHALEDILFGDDAWSEEIDGVKLDEVDYNVHNWDSLLEDRRATPGMGLVDDGIGNTIEGVYGRDYPEENLEPREDGVAPEWSGFWRPHRLY